MSYSNSTAGKNLRDLHKALSDAVTIVKDTPNQPGIETTRKHYNEVAEALVKIEEALADVGETLSIPRPTDFSGFLSTVGESMVNAQKEMDGQSEAYLIENRLRQHVLPSVYRIPKVSASVQFSMKHVSKRGFKLGFQKTTSKDEQLNQSLEFEIIAAPPPPELVNRLRTEADLLPQVTFVFGQERTDVLERVQKQVPDLASMNINHPLRDLKKTKNRLLIWRIEGETDYFLLYADKTKDAIPPTSLGIWRLTTTDGQDQLNIVFKFGVITHNKDTVGENLWLLRDLVASLCAQQEVFFKQAPDMA